MKLFKTFSLYTFLGFLNAGVGFFLLPVLTKYLSPADYGVISLMNAYVAILTPIVGLSTAGFVTVEYFNFGEDKAAFRKIFSSVRIIPIFGILLLLLIFLAGVNIFPALMELPLPAYWLVLPLLLFSLYQNNFNSYLLTTKRAKLYTVSTISKIAIEVSVTLLLIVQLGYHWDGRIYSALLTAVLITTASLFFYHKWKLLTIEVQKTYIRQAILFGLPLILHQIGKFVINQSDRLFLVKMVSVEEMGIYSVGYVIGSSILIVVTAFSNFFNPFLFENLKKGGEKAKMEIVRVSYIFLAIVLLILMLLSLFTPFLFRNFINVKYAGAAKYVFWIGLGYFFWSFYNIFSGYIFYLKKTKILGWVALINVLLNCVFNYLFISWFGAIGAAYATCLSFFIVALIIAVWVNRLYPMPWLSFFKKENIT